MILMKFYLLDDDKHIRMILKQIITDRELGTVCGTGSNGHEGLEDVFELKPDIIIVDLLMPEMDGITFVEHARTRLPDTAFIMLSQVSSKEMVSAAYEAGIEFFIQKPVNSIEVENVIQKVRQNLSMKRTLQKFRSFSRKISPELCPKNRQAPPKPLLTHNLCLPETNLWSLCRRFSRDLGSSVTSEAGIS